MVGAKTTKVFVLDKFTFSHEFTGLQSYTTYSVSVSGYTGGGEGPYTTPIVASELHCIVSLTFHTHNSAFGAIHLVSTQEKGEGADTSKHVRQKVLFCMYFVIFFICKVLLPYFVVFDSPIRKLLKTSGKYAQKIPRSCPKDSVMFEKVVPFHKICQKVNQ